MIQLHSMTLHRFRGVQDGVIQGLTDVNLFIGRNNAGKSTVVEAIMRLLSSFVGVEDILGRQVLQTCMQIRSEGSPFPPELWYRQVLSVPILLEGRLGDSSTHSLDKDLRLALRVTGEPSVNAQPNESTIEGGTTSTGAKQFLHGVTLFRPLDGLNRSIEQRIWPRLLASRRDKALTTTLNSIFGLQAESFQLLPDSRLMVLFEDHSLPLDVQGDGTRAAMRSLMVLTMLNGTLFLMEEPECHQHPGSLERFAGALCKQAHEQQIQLLVSTHSAECVRFFLQGTRAAGAEAAVFHLTLEQGHLEARRLDKEAVETLQSTGLDVRFLDIYAA